MILSLKRYLTLNAPDWFFIPLINFSNRLNGRRAKVRYIEPNIYSVSDDSDTIYCCRRNRLRRYFFGIQDQCARLSRTYLLHNITLCDGDVIIDCGANNGEIGVWARSRKMSYHAFEPETLESRCCDLNDYNGDRNTLRKGLWKTKTTLKWYSKPDSADSSLIEISDTDYVTSVETTTLNDFVDENSIDHIRIFKLEAEGAEPEVLQGALNVLNKIDYIAVDCGYERGVAKNHTFIEVYNILKKHEFDIVAAEFRRVVFLFKRRDAKA